MISDGVGGWQEVDIPLSSVGFLLYNPRIAQKQALYSICDIISNNDQSHIVNSYPSAT